MTINRRKFIRNSLLAGGSLTMGGLLPSIIYGAERTDNLTILHTNDLHSRLEPFPADAGKFAGMGGIEARAAIIKKIRNETEHVLLLDAGDIFQAGAYFSLFKGEPEIKAMSLMGYDAVTLGNHDFDGGIENFATQLNHANFPIIISNYDFAGTPMVNKYLPYKVFQKGKMKIGVLGVGIELKGLIAENLSGAVIYNDPLEKANEIASVLKQQGCDMIICLSHLGDKYDDNKISDEILAKECYDIDLIIGGHTHRFFTEPRVYRNKKGNDTVVNQAGWGGLQLGRLDYSFARTGKKNLLKSHTVLIGKKTME